MTRALQTLIHVGCRELGLDAETRRDLQYQVTGKASLRDMNGDELKLIVTALKDRGFVPKGARRGKHNSAPRADLRLVHVLWRKLGEADALERPGRDGLNAFVRSRFGKVWGSVPADIDMLRDHAQIDMVIQALKLWCDRVGADVDWDQVGR